MNNEGKKDNYNYPANNLLENWEYEKIPVANAELRKQSKRMAEIVQQTLDDSRAKAKVVKTVIAPQLIQFIVRLEQGVRFNKITALEGKIKDALTVDSVRIFVASIPGVFYVGIQVPRKDRIQIPFSSLLDNNSWKNSKARIPLALGKGIYGRSRILDLYKEHNLLIGGADESELKMCLDTIIASMLFKFSPNELNLILFDSKGHLEDYARLPFTMHTTTDFTLEILEGIIMIMEQRYKSFYNVKSIWDFHMRRPKQNVILDDDGRIPFMEPYIVAVIDDLADFMPINKDIELRLTQIAINGPQVGIYLILATSQLIPKVITGTIKANFPTRIAFRCNTSKELKMVISMAGACELFGGGDMLLNTNYDRERRIQCASLSKKERDRIIDSVANKGNMP